MLPTEDAAQLFGSGGGFSVRNALPEWQAPAVKRFVANLPSRPDGVYHLRDIMIMIRTLAWLIFTYGFESRPAQFCGGAGTSASLLGAAPTASTWVAARRRTWPWWGRATR
eukprot:COSAG01_NODE_1232_length_11111_cov_24.710770_14_plen_111_part_00